jgi:hypothetical protein
VDGVAGDVVVGVGKLADLAALALVANQQGRTLLHLREGGGRQKV